MNKRVRHYYQRRYSSDIKHEKCVLLIIEVKVIAIMRIVHTV